MAPETSRSGDRTPAILPTRKPPSESQPPPWALQTSPNHQAPSKSPTKREHQQIIAGKKEEKRGQEQTHVVPSPPTPTPGHTPAHRPHLQNSKPSQLLLPTQFQAHSTPNALENTV
ncbi:hypothetical protein SUGI_0833200 [Cryptomeria japonica]|nr:hypothetical protein SUGI_0833200 [Cryptomeria japonica]